MTDVADIESYRGELRRYCYRYFGCYAEAEDAVQETFVRAWKHLQEFERRSSLRRWLYAIATNVCLDMRGHRQRRALPMDLTGPGAVPDDLPSLTVSPEATWITPIADHHLAADPAGITERRETVRLAFITALQALPPRQRVVLILADVLAWSAKECAALLDTTVAAVNSALARARTTLRRHDPAEPAAYDEQLLTNYVAAFEAYDVDRLVALLADDARFSMPPYDLWFQGTDAIEAWWRGPGEVCRGSRTIVTGANGQPAVAVYHPVESDPESGQRRWDAFAVHVLDVAHGRIAAITHFMGSHVFSEFGLPTSLVGSPPEHFPQQR
ncbi:MAG: sigma-70 family RNA polymerase sigma factor [Propionibacterium sp.]|nr:sigma-70 family RNA polymerase sigma factor [Propionibacterium sp.]